MVALTIATGVREVQFRHRETSDLLALRDATLRRQAIRPFSVAAVVGPSPDSGYGFQPGRPAPTPGGRLRFLLRATLPELRQTDLIHVDDLRSLPQDGPWLVILAGSSERLSYPLQARLALEAIHPGRPAFWGPMPRPLMPTRATQARVKRIFQNIYINCVGVGCAAPIRQRRLARPDSGVKFRAEGPTAKDRRSPLRGYERQSRNSFSYQGFHPWLLADAPPGLARSEPTPGLDHPSPGNPA